MVTKEDLEKRYESLSNSELLDIIHNKHQYTELAVTVAESVLGKREISSDEIAKHNQKQYHEFVDKVEKNYVDDITLFQKALFFFLCFIDLVAFTLKNNYRRDGFVLKLNQVNYYSRFGFVSVFAVVICSLAWNLGNFASFLIWFLFFLISLYIDLKIRLPKRLETLDTVINSPKNTLQ